VLQRMLADPARRSALGAAAAARAAERFSWDRCAARYLALCDAVVA